MWSTRAECCWTVPAGSSTPETAPSPSPKRIAMRAAVPPARRARPSRPTTIERCTARCSSSGITWSTVGSASWWSDASRTLPGTRRSSVTSPLGLIPRELERFYPAGAYDIPVTGDWSRDEAAMVTDDLRAFLATNRYDTVVAHLGAEAPIVKAAVPNVIPTSKERPTSDESVASLTAILNHVTSSAPPVPKGLHFSEEMSNVARFQFGEAGLGLVRGAPLRGAVPGVPVVRGGTQVARDTGRGMLSPTLARGWG